MSIFRRRSARGAAAPSRRIDVQAPTVQAVPVFAPDARGAALFHGIANATSANQQINSGVRIDARGETWGGWTSPPQVLRSIGLGVGLGAGRPVVAEGAEIDEERSLGSTSVERAFAQRMAAGRFS